jgi:PmbA protein
MVDVLNELLRRASARGATAADTFLIEEEHSTVQVRLGQVETVKHAREQRLSLRVFKGRAAASASTSDLSRSSLDQLVDEAVGLSRVTAEDPMAGLPVFDELAKEVPDLDLADPDGHRLTPEEKIDLAKRAEAAALESDSRIMNSEGAEFFERQAELAYASSLGWSGRYRTSIFSLTVSPVAVADGQMQRDSWYSLSRKRHRLEPPETIGQIAARRTLKRLGARKVKTCEVPVIFDPESAGSLLHALAIAASGPSLYRRASFLVDRIGEKIASPSVTIVDDGARPCGLGSRPFDGEGLGTRRVELVKDGILTSYLLDSYSGRKLDRTSTAHAVRDASGVTVGATNLYLAPGQDRPEALIESVDSGFYVTELIGFGVNFVTGDYSRGAVGHWIEKGELAYPVEEITIAGNLLQMFQAIDGIGNDLVFRNRVSSPTIRIGRMTVAGE